MLVVIVNIRVNGIGQVAHAQEVAAAKFVGGQVGTRPPMPRVTRSDHRPFQDIVPV